MSSENNSSSAEGVEFDPYSFAERWFEEHPEVLDKIIAAEERMNKIRKTNDL